MSSSVDIVRLTRRHRSAFVTLMCRAFADDPLFLHLYPGDRAERERAMRPFVAFMFDATGWRADLRLGLFHDDALTACALIDRPHRTHTALAGGYALTLLRFLPLLLHLHGSQIRFLNTYMRDTRKASPDAPHHYLAMIGVDPAHQGQGLGQKLMTSIIDRAGRDPSATGIALDTENETNVAFYRRLGFMLRERISIGPCQAACMFRPRGETA